LGEPPATREAFAARIRVEWGIETHGRAQCPAYADRMVALGAVIAADAPGRRGPDEVTLFWPVGLAGTEVFLLDALTGRVDRAEGGVGVDRYPR
jgi:ornithine cyclodeaminase/alanine dehydrogenase-like protein (mu-crystallin family)